MRTINLLGIRSQGVQENKMQSYIQFSSFYFEANIIRPRVPVHMTLFIWHASGTDNKNKTT